MTQKEILKRRINALSDTIRGVDKYNDLTGHHSSPLTYPLRLPANKPYLCFDRFLFENQKTELEAELKQLENEPMSAEEFVRSCIDRFDGTQTVKHMERYANYRLEHERGRGGTDGVTVNCRNRF